MNTGFGTVTSREDAIMLIEEDLADAAVVGRPVIANPDLARIPVGTRGQARRVTVARPLDSSSQAVAGYEMIRQ